MFMKYCGYCGGELKDDAKFCNMCGNKCNTMHTNVTTVQPVIRVENQVNSSAVIGFIFSLLSIFGFSIPGLALSAYGIANAKLCNGKGKGLAVAGLVISIIAIISTIVFFAVIMYDSGYEDGYDDGRWGYDWY